MSQPGSYDADFADTAPATTPQAQTATNQATPSNPASTIPMLPTAIPDFRQETRPALDAINLCSPHIPRNPPTLSFRSSPSNQDQKNQQQQQQPQDASNILLVIPTANKFKTKLLTAHLASNTTTTTALTIPAESGVGEQPYDSAGPEGAFNRVINAAKKLAANEEPGYAGVIVQRGIGTVIVGAVENFIMRQPGHDEEGHESVEPVDYGVVVLCRIPLLPAQDGSQGKHLTSGEWEWKVGVSRGVTAPVAYWRAAEKEGFADEESRFGRKTVGKVLAEHVEGLDGANWHLPLAGVSRYALLEEVMREMDGLPWVRVGDVGK